MFYYIVSLIVLTKITPTKLKVFFESYDVVWSFPNKKQDKGINPPRFKRFFCVLNVGTVVEGKQCGFPLHWIHVDGWTGREDKPTQCPMKLSERNVFCQKRTKHVQAPKETASLKIYLPEIWSAKRSCFTHKPTATIQVLRQSRGSEKIVKWIGSLLWLKPSRVTAQRNPKILTWTVFGETICQISWGFWCDLQTKKSFLIDECGIDIKSCKQK